MTEPLLGARRALPAASGTLVTLSAAALRANLARAGASVAPAGSDPWAADAWGHGEAWVRSILEAAGIDPDAARTWSGDVLYGLHADSRPVMRLSGHVLSTKDLRAGEGVSYGYLHRAARDTRVALVTGGYAQGVVRALGGRVAVALGGALCPIVGRVAMDVCVVDVGMLEVARGDEAVFFGDPLEGAPSVAGWAAASGLTSAEIVASAGVKGRRVTA